MTVKASILIIWILGITTVAYSQCPEHRSVWDSIRTIEKNAQESLQESREKLIRLKNTFLTCKLTKDSVYARLLHRLSAVRFLENGRVATKEALDEALEAVTINASGKEGAAPDYLVNTYFNLGLFFASLSSNEKASAYYDSAIIVNTGRSSSFALSAGYQRAKLFSASGEYQKCIEECHRSLMNAKALNDTEWMMKFLNEQSQAFLYLESFSEAVDCLTRAEAYADTLENDFEKASAMKNRARILAAQHQYEPAGLLFEKTITRRIRTNRFDQVADDYIDFGSIYFQQKDFKKARHCFSEALRYAAKDNNSDQLAKAWHNLCAVEIESTTVNYAIAEQYFNNCLQQLGVGGKSMYGQLRQNELSSVGNKDLLIALLKTRTAFLLKRYKQTGDPQLISKCIEAALLTDTLLTTMRFEHTEERSKLYWRELTRDFFSQALEACYLAGDYEHAFFFMEKSRAVLLYDRINERTAADKLPEEEIRQEQHYKYRLMAVQGQLSLGISEDENRVQLMLLKDSLDRHIRKLELNYPEYYRIKYESAMPSLDAFQRRLLPDEVFIHYHIGESVAYALTVARDKVSMHTLQPDPGDIADFMKMCAGRQYLNQHYPAFTALSRRLNNALFNPLGITQQRVIVCLDHYLLPFDAFCDDDGSFLIYRHAFSYAYSAALLMQNNNQRKEPGAAFAGFAPSSFAPRLYLPDLKRSVPWLRSIASLYSTSASYTGEQASKRNFINQVAGYAVVNVFSHATADTGKGEPVLYMQDSLISLSELQVFDRSATQLIMLSACQTNVGRKEAGEGIYSLARGFATIGIPAVASTLWVADEEAVYHISNGFHAGLAKGMPADEALRQAKLDYLSDGARSRQLPYYWAAMVLMGDNSALELTNTLLVRDSILVGLLLLIAVWGAYTIARLIKKV